MLFKSIIILIPTQPINIFYYYYFNYNMSAFRRIIRHHHRYGSDEDSNSDDDFFYDDTGAAINVKEDNKRIAAEKKEEDDAILLNATCIQSCHQLIAATDPVNITAVESYQKELAKYTAIQMQCDRIKALKEELKSEQFTSDDYLFAKYRDQDEAYKRHVYKISLRREFDLRFELFHDFGIKQVSDLQIRAASLIQMSDCVNCIDLNGTFEELWEKLEAYEKLKIERRAEQVAWNLLQKNKKR